jgi:hypothetical protein
MMAEDGWQARIREIQTSFIMGYLDRETCIEQFEQLLHEYGVLPPDEGVDRTITNDSFMALLKVAKEYKDARPTRTPKDALPAGVEPMYDLTSLSSSIAGRCPVCREKASGLYNRIQMSPFDRETVPIDPPRCRNCMMKWVQENVTDADIRSAATPHVPPFSEDDSLVKPLDAAETDFFASYEKEMAKFKP